MSDPPGVTRDRDDDPIVVRASDAPESGGFLDLFPSEHDERQTPSEAAANETPVAPERAVPGESRGPVSRLPVAEPASRLTSSRRIIAVSAIVFLIATAGIYLPWTGSIEPPTQRAMTASLPFRSLTPAAQLRPPVRAARIQTDVAPESAPAPDVDPADERAIAAVLNAYRDGMAARDVSAVRAAWPTVSVIGLERQFAGLAAQRIVFDSCRLARAEETVNAFCSGAQEMQFDGGARRVERKQWQFSLRKSDGRWTVYRVGSELR
jgi:hypothetical protein